MALISCPECEKEISNKVKSCPHCGYPLVEDVPEESVLPQRVEVAEIQAPKNAKRVLGIIIPCIVVIVAVIVGIVAYNNSLFGDDKLAYDILIEAAQKFKDPSSVRLVSGRVGNRITMDCGISAKNDYGSRVTSYYWILVGVDDITLNETKYPRDEHKDTTSLNIDKINKALEKTLGLD